MVTNPNFNASHTKSRGALSRLFEPRKIDTPTGTPVPYKPVIKGGRPYIVAPQWFDWELNGSTPLVQAKIVVYCKQHNLTTIDRCYYIKCLDGNEFNLSPVNLELRRGNTRVHSHQYT